MANPFVELQCNGMFRAIILTSNKKITNAGNKSAVVSSLNLSFILEHITNSSGVQIINVSVF